ncbi:hemolysin family protein [Candidatus Micrarchaeota archaeon]|nr:hemolysin family protein [Candidatus Micrarchaeota archaeon]
MVLHETQIAEIIALMVMLVFSAFFSGCEVAFLSISNVKLHSLLEKKAKGADSLARLRQNRRRVIISILIGNNIVNVASSALATSIALNLFGDAGLGIAVGVMFFLILTFGEIAPKSAATTYGEKAALAMAPAIEFFCWLFLPLVLIFEFINKLIPGVYSKATKLERFTEEEIRSAVKLGVKHQSISQKEKELIENVLEFNDRTIAQAMTPKSGVFVLDAKMSVPDAYKKALDTQFSRFPVLNGKEVVGITNIKRLGFAYLYKPDSNVEGVMWQPVKVLSYEKASDVFLKFQEVGRNIAIVINEKDEFIGVITLEDLLEELVGEIK